MAPLSITYNTTGASCNWFVNTNSMSQWTKCKYTPTTTGTYTLSDCEEEWYGGMMSRKLVPGVTYDLPDGAKLVVDHDGNYRIDDKDAKVTYRANRSRDFSPHLNASDLVAQFIEYVGGLGVRRADVMGLPIHLFISWLIIQAAERDGDSIPREIVRVEESPLLLEALKPRCLKCGRFIRRLHHQHRFPFCSPEHGALFVASRKLLTCHPAISA